MNLIPIDGGGTPPELIGGGTAPEGDFAALMTGLMSGDTQIVPLLDLPIDAQPTDGTEPGVTDAQVDEIASILELVGSPPAGAVSAPIADSPPAWFSPVEAAFSSIKEGDEPSLVTPPTTGSTSPVVDGEVTTAPDDGIGAVVAAGLATVHPITSRTAVQPSDHDATVTGAADTDGLGTANRPPKAASVGAPPTEVPTAPAEPRLDQVSQRSPVVAQQPASDTEFAVDAEPEAAATQHDVEVDSGPATRSIETGRPTSSVSRPVMVGVARRVEEAIAALASKPDPKILTLQLDELDGMRLTVALRPDGLHLSSNGDTALRMEIERALESRGFDMASDGNRNRQNTEQQSDDGWRPTSAGRPRRTNPSGIRF